MSFRSNLTDSEFLARSGGNWRSTIGFAHAANMLGAKEFGHPARVLFVHNEYGHNSGNTFNGAEGEIPDAPVASIARAQKIIRNNSTAAGFSPDNVIICLPGHQEDIAAASAYSSGAYVGLYPDIPGTRVYGIGDRSPGEFAGANSTNYSYGRPKLTLSATASNIGFTVPNCKLSGFDICPSVASVTAPVVIGSGADDCEISNCRFYLDGDVATPTNWMTLHASADNFLFRGNGFSPQYTAYKPPLDILRMIAEEGWNYVRMTVNGATAAHNTVAAHCVLRVTGQLQVLSRQICTTDLTDAGSGTLIYGYIGADNAIIGSTTAANIDAGELWLSTSPAPFYLATAAIRDGQFNMFSVSGANLIYTVGTGALTAGTLDFDILYKQGRPQSLGLPGQFGATS